MRAKYETASASPVAQVIEGLTFMTGLYMAISPWVVGFNSVSTTLTISNLIVGIAFAVLALGFGSIYERIHRLAWTAPLLGIWILISQWVVVRSPDQTSIIVNNGVTGFVGFLCGMAMLAVALMGAGRSGRRR